MDIVNSTFTFSLGQTLDLDNLASTLWNIEYNPRKFPSVVLRLKEPQCTTLISASGKVVVVGCKSEQQAMKASRLIRRQVLSAAPGVEVSGLTCRNLVGSTTHDFDLTPYWNVEGKRTFHNPSLFPGLQVTLAGKARATLFASGVLYITGVDSEKRLEEAHLELCFLLV